MALLHNIAKIRCRYIYTAKFNEKKIYNHHVRHRNISYESLRDGRRLSIDELALSLNMTKIGGLSTKC